jgi:ribosomal-protein-alanine N-acetyltransferase
MEVKVMIKGRNVLLRMVRELDLDLLFSYAGDIEGRGLYYPIFLSSEAEFRRRFEETGFWKEEYGELLVCDLEDRMLGVVSYYRAAPYFDGFEVAARLFDISMSNRNIMSEALSLFNYLLFTVKKINRLEARIMPENGASKRMAEKCGYRFEGVARGAVFHRGAYRDMEVYSMLREEAPATLEEALNRVGK